MKHLLTLLCIVVGLNCMGQYVGDPEPTGNKQQYNFIIMWRTWCQQMHQHGDMMSSDWEWKTDFAGFTTQKELIEWLNVSRFDGWANSSEHQDKYTRITENQLIAAYDLVNMKKINISFKTVEKQLPKRVELQAEKWKETTAEIKN